MQPSDRLTQIAETLRQSLGWSFEAAYIGARAHFRCEYCGRPLLRSLIDYDVWQRDHIIPVSKSPDLSGLDNLALTCKPCNFFKRNMLPDRDEVLTGDRDQQIAFFRPIIKRLRSRKMAELAEVRGVIQSLFPDLDLDNHESLDSDEV